MTFLFGPVKPVDFYVRIKRIAKWNLLSAKRSTFPFYDDSPPAGRSYGRARIHRVT
jgi:hypothetical protein